MAGERTFLVRLIGNADGAVAAFKKLGKEGEKTLGQLQTVGNAIGGAFDVVRKAAFIAVGAFTAVAGAATAAALAAAEDEQSQRRLASQLERTTGASKLQVEAIERFITSAMLATGVADTDLRNGFANLARATGDATQSQRLLNLALDISAATGKDLESVTIALGKASSGQVTALSKLGIPIDENTKKSKDFGSALSQLEAQFGGAAAASADTFSGRMKILQASLGEVVESIGFALLPFFEKMVKFIQDNILPALIAFADNVGEYGIVKSIGFAINAMGDLGITFLDTLEGMTLAVLNFLKNFADLGRTIALTAGFTAALTGNAPVAIKATAASLAFKAAQQGLNTALEATPRLFDSIRASMAQAAIIQARALPSIIGTADALERQVVAGKKNIVVEKEQVTVGGGVAKTVETAKQKFEKYTDALKSSTSAQKAFNNAQKGSAQAADNLKAAQDDVAAKQKALNDAVNGFGADSDQAKKAQRELSAAQRNVAQAGFRVEEAVFAVADAEKALAELRADPQSSAQAIRQAEIDLAQAKLAVADASDSEFDATNKLKDAQLVLNEAVSGAIIGSDTYNKLLDAVNDAKIKEKEASDRLTDAVERETEAYENLAEAIKKVAEAAATMPNRNLTIPSLPTVPTPGMAAGGGTSATGGAGTNININTGIGTNGVEAGRQIVEVLQQYSRIAGGNFLEFAVA
jgi:hypothetical protein